MITSLKTIYSTLMGASSVPVVSDKREEDFLDYALVVYQDADIEEDGANIVFKEHGKKAKWVKNEKQLDRYLTKRRDIDVWTIQHNGDVTYKFLNFDHEIETFKSKKNLQNRLADVYGGAWVEQAVIARSEATSQSMNVFSNFIQYPKFVPRYYKKTSGWFSSSIDEISKEQYRSYLIEKENDSEKRKIKSAAIIGSVILGSSSNLITKVAVENTGVWPSLDMDSIQMNGVHYSSAMIAAGMSIVSFPKIKTSAFLLGLCSLLPSVTAQPWVSQMPSNFSLTCLNGNNGVKFVGSNHYFLSSVSFVEDINGDGKSDLLIGALSQGCYAGVAYLIYSSPWLNNPIFSLSSLNYTNSVKLVGLASANCYNDGTGLFVNSVKDMNGDGIPDLIIGAINYVYLVYSGPWLQSSTFLLENLNGTTGVKLLGKIHSVSSVRDVNGDGVPDLIMGGPVYQTNEAAYLIYSGPWLKDATFSLSNLNGTNGIKLLSNTYDHAGFSIGSIEDMNGDGKADLIIGAPNAYGGTGGAFLIYSGPWLNSSTFSLYDLNGTNGVKIMGIGVSDSVGNSVSSAGDVNGDGKVDLIIGTSAYINEVGSAYLVYGGPWLDNAVFSLFDLNGTNGVKITGTSFNDLVGFSVSSAGDINGDGKMDLIIGAPEYLYSQSKNAGNAYLVYGGVWLDNPTFSLSDINGTNGVKLLGVSVGDRTGYSVSSVGGVNRERDLIIGTSAGNIGSSTSGIIYLIYGGGNFTVWNNELFISRGNNVLLNARMINVTGISHKNLVITIDNVQHGHFEFSFNPKNPIITFSYDEVNASKVCFVHDGSAFSPSYSISVFNKEGLYQFFGSIPASVGFVLNPPILTNSHLSVARGRSFVLSSQHINSTDLAFPPKNVNYTVSGTQYGFFSVISDPQKPIASFTQLDVNQAKVQFVHLGSGFSPSYFISLSDPGMSLSPAVGRVDFIQNPPTFLSNNFTINRGQSFVLSSDQLSASDLAFPVSNVTFNIHEFSGGFFSFISKPNDVILSFTQLGLEQGQVQFSQDGAGLAPSFKISLSDPGMQSDPVDGNIIFNQNPPQLFNNSLVIIQGGSLTLNLSNLAGLSLAYNNQKNWVFAVAALKYGYFELINQPGVYLSQFSQQDINELQVRFVQDGTGSPSSCNITFSDPGMSASPVAMNVSFVPVAPVLMNNRLMINQRQSVSLSPNQLSATGVNPSASLSLKFVMHDIAHGSFSKSEFLQEEILSIIFTHDGSAIAPNYTVSIVDGEYTYGPFIPKIYFNKAPIILKNQLNISQGASVILDSENLKATDEDNAQDNIYFFINSLQRGEFFLASNPNIPVTQFSQEQVLNGEVQFKQDGTNIAPNYTVTAKDSYQANSAASQASIRFFSSRNPQQDSENNKIRNAVIGLSISTALGLSFFLVRFLLMRKAVQLVNREIISEKESLLGTQEHHNAALKPIFEVLSSQLQLTNWMGYMSENTRKAYIQSIVVLIVNLENQNIGLDFDSVGEEERGDILREIANQVRVTVLPKRSACFKLTHFFSPEITPRQIKDHAEKIAASVKKQLACSSEMLLKK